jgi:dTDP-glucose pyrophosphorylase
MKTWKATLIGPDATIRDAIGTLDDGALQIALVVDPAGRLVGTVTDGDVRRALLRGLGLDTPIHAAMNPSPITFPASMPPQARFALMRQRDLKQVPILDDMGRIVGLETIEELLHQGRRDNWVVLMAGGLGQRLRPLTQDCPKPLLPVGGRPLLETILQNFVAQGFSRFFISVNYKAEMVKEHFGDGSRWGVEIEYLHEDTKLGTAGALALLPARPELPMIVMNGDLLTATNFGRLLDFHDEQTAAATIAVREYSMQVPYGVVTVEHNYLTGIIEKPMHAWFINAGIYVIGPQVLDRIGQGETLDMPSLLERVLAASQTVATFPIREYWLDIGRIEDLERATLEYPTVFQ